MSVLVEFGASPTKRQTVYRAKTESRVRLFIKIKCFSTIKYHLLAKQNKKGQKL